MPDLTNRWRCIFDWGLYSEGAYCFDLDGVWMGAYHCLEGAEAQALRWTCGHDTIRFYIRYPFCRFGGGTHLESCTIMSW